MVIFHQLKALEEDTGMNSLRKVDPQAEKLTQTKRVEESSKPGFWKFHQEGVLEECMHPGVARDC